MFPPGETEIGGQNEVKKQLPGWAVLLIITLVAGLALGGTNALTKDPIAQQALIKAENARKAALPDAESFEELALTEGASVDWVYAGLKDGSPVGYVAQKTVNGFGGKVEVIAGVDTVNAPDTFKIGGITVGGSDFSETAGLGARAKEPAFTDQFPGKIYPISYIKAGGEATESTVDALTSATITTTAVVNGVNDIVKYVKADVMGIAGVEMPAKPADGVFSSSEKGFRGPVYVEAAFDGAGKVTYMKVGDEAFAEDIGAGVIEPDFMIQFIGKQMPLEVSDIDVIAGATISSTAVVKALNNAYAIASGAEIVVPETPTMPEKPAEGVFSASADGFRGPVYVEAAFDADNKVTYISVGDDSFAEDIGMGVKEPEFMAQFIGKTAPMEVSDIDVITGATISSTAVVNGLNKAYNASQGIVEEVVEIVMPEKPAEGVFSASEKGFAGPVYTEAAFDADGKITYISVGDDQFAETEGFGAKALVAENLHPFIGAQMPLNVEDVDALTGATFTKTAIVNSLNKAYKASKGEVEEEPVKQEAPAAAPAGETFGADAEGFQSTVHVEAAFDGDKITALTIGDKRFDETPGFGAKALEPEVAEAFIGKTVPMKVEDIDVLTGATFTKTAVVEALNKAYTKYQAAQEAPAEEPAAEAVPENAVSASVQGFGGPVAISAAFDDAGKISYFKIVEEGFAETPGLGAKALEEDFQKQFVGKQMPLSLGDIDAIAGATITSTAVVDALNQAYDQVKPAAEEPAAATFGADAEGFQSTVHVEAAFDGDKITALTIGDKRFDETPGFGAKALEPEVAEAFIGKTVPLAVEDVDTLTGATFTKTAVVEALNKAYTKYQAAQEAPAEEPAAASGSAVSATAQGFGGPVYVEAEFDGNKIASIKIGDDQFAETSGLGARALEEDFQKQFIGKQMPIALSDIDALSGATITTAAVVDALNEAYASVAGSEEAAPETSAVEAKTYTAEINSADKVLKLEATVEGGKITALRVTPSDREAALQEKFVGAALPLSLQETDIDFFSVSVALNKAAGAEAVPATEAAEPTVAEQLLAKNFNTTGEATIGGKDVQVIVTCVNNNIAGLVVLDKETGSETSYDISERDAEMKDLFLAKSLPLDPDAQDSAYAAAIASLINEACGVEGASKEENAFAKAEKVLAKNIGVTAETAVSGKDLQIRVINVNNVVAGLVVLEKAEDCKVSALDAEMKNLFLAKSLPLDVNGQGTVMAATIANAINVACGFEAQEIAVKEAKPVEAALPVEQEPAEEKPAVEEKPAEPAEEKPAEPAEEKPAEPAEEKPAETGASFLTLRVTAEFENDALSSLTVLEKAADGDEFLPSAQEEALKEMFIGQPLPLDTNRASALESTTAIAINKAYYDAIHEAEPQQDDEPVYLGEAISSSTAIRATIKISPTGTVKIAQFEEKPVDAEEYAFSPRDEELQALFVGEPLPLDLNAYDDAFEGTAALAVNAAYQQFLEMEDENGSITDSFGFGESISSSTLFRVAAAFENGRLVTFGAYKTPLNSETVEPIDCVLLNELLDGQEMPLPADGWTAADLAEDEMTAVVTALNQAYENSLAGLQ